MSSRIVIGVMGPGAGATESDLLLARELGRLIATEGWLVLCGGRNSGVMDAVARGAKEANGVTIGVLPSSDRQGASGSIDIVISTGMGSARNNINVLSSSVVVSCGMGCGTASEVALALKAEKPVVLLNAGPEAEVFFRKLDPQRVKIAKDPSEAIRIIRTLNLA